MTPRAALPPGLVEAFDHYVDQERSGARAGAATALATFLGRFGDASASVRSEFAEALARRTLDSESPEIGDVAEGVRLRTTLFSHAMLPHLLDRFQEEPFPAGRRLAKAAPFFATNRRLHEELGRPFDPVYYLRAALTAEPTDAATARALKAELLSVLAHWTTDVPESVLVAPEGFDEVLDEVRGLIDRFGGDEALVPRITAFGMIAAAWRERASDPAGPSFEERLRARGWAAEE